MTKEKYLEIRGDNAQILYSFYKENIKNQPMLSIEQFVPFMQMWPLAQQSLEKVISYYDATFEIMTITDIKTGNVIKYV